MPRANRNYHPGYVWHLTYRYHRRQFLLNFVRDRLAWEEWLFVERRRFGLCVLNYTDTRNGIHLLVCDRGGGEIAARMQLIAGCTAQQFNRRKRRGGSPEFRESIELSRSCPGRPRLGRIISTWHHVSLHALAVDNQRDRSSMLLPALRRRVRRSGARSNNDCTSFKKGSQESRLSITADPRLSRPGSNWCTGAPRISVPGIVGRGPAPVGGG